ncbi:hypothetical protein KR51_00028990 [Rubidibacter lacunae KORDI 51-2]|uniref:DUF4178 domain-containing protein n=1 Tax=Rubidibacter lacunae KORDI 51-2 TaxID=582515 RepID=U5DH42_9CHRO|nr:DUF4178 domain-containing protein [Rubidibacter lacunae]ERN40572.1 hypothetical protein KR51_00028990 [Rubidibacter lacunae KORDI 51-2]
MPLPIFVAILLVTGFVLAIVWFASKRRGRRRPNRSERNPFNLQIGDIVDHMGTFWAVEGILTYEDGGYTWLEYMLLDADRIAWLAVEEDDVLEISLSYPTKELDVSNPPPPQLDFQGDRYRLVESGTATMTRTGNTRDRDAERCHYYDYEGPEDKVLAIERWGSTWEVTYGESLSLESLRLLPGEGESLYRPG